MVSESIVQTLAGRLRTHPPFDRLDPELIRALAECIRVRYFDRKEIIFEAGNEPNDEVYLVHKGGVRIVRDGELAAMCEPGDLFGVRAHLANRNYAADATVDSDALLYCWPADTFIRWVQSTPALSAHLAAGFAVEGPIAKGPSPQIALESDTPLEPSRNLLSCAPETTVQEAARRMTERRVGSILVLDEEKRPVGIVTDVDLRRRIVAEGRSPELTTVSAIMSTPVLTVHDAPSRTEATITMTGSGIHHLVTTEDGTPETRATGLIADHDLLVASGEDPASIARSLRRATGDDALRRARERLDRVLQSTVEASIPINVVARVASAVTDRLTGRAIELALDECGPAPAPFAWLGLGSQGRREQIVRTDQDNALVFSQGPHRDYFKDLAERTVAKLEAAGFERCPGNMMASNSDWCGDAEHWRSVFRKWIEVPEPSALMHSNIFFDFRSVFGEHKLENDLRDFIFSLVQAEGRFLPMLAKSALHNPAPLSFFKGFVLERSGSHRDEFDVKARAMMPLADAARVLSLELGVREVGTAERFRAIAKREDGLADPCESAAAAYETLMQVRTRQGFRGGAGGRFLDIQELSSFDRQRLRQSFSALDRMQRLLTVRYQTDAIR